MIRRAPGAIAIGLVVGYAVLGLVVLDPDAVYSGDIGVKFVEARALTLHRFASLDIPYPAARLDPRQEFFPIRPPFVMTVGRGTQAIFPPASSVIQALAVAAAGLSGLIVLSIAGAAVILIAVWWMAPGGEAWIALAALGVGSPLWFYAVSGWEHAPAVAFGAAAFACAFVAPIGTAPIVAGVLVGMGATMRDEVVLLLPGLLFLIWLRSRAVRPVLVTLGCSVLPLAAAAMLEVGWFRRPPAAHLRHAVHLVQKAVHLTTAPNPELPVRTPLTMRQRYETVVQYWLLGYSDDRFIALAALGLVVALLLRRIAGTSIGLVVWLVAILGLAVADLREVVAAPKWLGGVHRVAPYAVFAVLPRPLGTRRRSYLWSVVLVSTAAYLAIAAAGVDTSGGKSLGPRLLLPLVPLLAVSATANMAAYIRARSRFDRIAGWIGACLVVVAILIHAVGSIPAYVERNRADASAIRAARATFETWVVADEEFTAQLLLPLYYAKIVLLADSAELGRSLAKRLDENRVTRFIVVSRRSTAQMSMRPFDLERIEPAGRMAIQYWSR